MFEFIKKFFKKEEQPLILEKEVSHENEFIKNETITETKSETKSESTFGV